MKAVSSEQMSFEEEFAQFRKGVNQRLTRLEARLISLVSLTIVRIQLPDPWERR